MERLEGELARAREFTMESNEIRRLKKVVNGLENEKETVM